MGCDIHIYAEKKTNSGWESANSPSIRGYRSYGLFGFLAGVRNYSAIPPISEPRGIPADAAPATIEEYESWSGDAHSASWLSVDELTNFDYDAPVEDRRCTRRTHDGYISSGETCEPGEGNKTTFREFLGDLFLNYISDLKKSGAGRVVFWFDS